MQRPWTSLSGLPLLTQNKKLLGHLNGVFMNPENGQVIAYLVGIAKVLAPTDIEKWSKEYVQVNNASALTPPSEILRLSNLGLRRCLLNGKKVRSFSGKSYGRIKDFTVHTETSSVITFESAKGFLWLKWDHRIFPIEDISEITSSGIILKTEPEQKLRLKAPLEATASF